MTDHHHDPVPPAGGAEPEFHSECYRCPVGSAFQAVDVAQPAMTHLLAALTELATAARLFIESAQRAVARVPTTPAGARASRVEKITVEGGSGGSSQARPSPDKGGRGDSEPAPSLIGGSGRHPAAHEPPNPRAGDPRAQT